jgi:hypothetical protein
MLIIILSWVYITTMAYLTGVGIHAVIGSVTGDRTAVQMHFSLKCLSGLMGITFISTLACLFMPLGLLFNCLELVIVIGTALFYRAELRLSWRGDRDRVWQGHWASKTLFIAVVLIMAYLSYMPSSHYDDGLYYSTTIRWLEEYGTVKGIANINPRIAFNSSWHILQANFGFRWLKLGLFNDMNGLLFLLVFLYSMGGMSDLLKGKSSFTAGIRALFMLPILAFHFGATSDVMPFNVNFISSSTPDIPTCLLIFMVFLLFLEGEDGRAGDIASMDMLVVLYSVWLCSIKFSAIPIVLLSCFIVVRCIRLRLFRLVVFLVTAGIVFITPWFIRNVLVSGYLLFPLSSIDLFHVPWKIPARDVKWFENAIKAYILSSDIDHKFNIPFTQWFPRWLSGLDFIRQVIMGMVGLATLSYIVTGLWQLLRRGTGFFIRHQRKVIYIVAGITGILFWLTQAPDFRFGYGFLLFYCIFFITALFYIFLEGYYRRIAVPALLYVAALFFIYYRHTWTSIKPYFAGPIPYRMPAEIHKTELKKGRDIYLVGHEDSWNAPLPAANENEFNVLLPVYMSTTVGEGFRSTEKQEY